MKKIPIAGLGIMILILISIPATADDLRDWGIQIPDAAVRFVILDDFSKQAVLDKETQLVWELKAGDANQDGFVNTSDYVNWEMAIKACVEKVVGGRMGWRLPAVNELTSILAYNSDIGRMAPPVGHPFIGIDDASQIFWSATSLEVATAIRNSTVEHAFWVSPLPLVIGAPSVGTREKSYKTILVWCVRSGSTGPHQY